MGIKIRGETHNFSHKALRLKSPIQVIYPSDSDRLDDVSRTENPPGYDMCISPLSSSYNENAATGAREQVCIAAEVIMNKSWMSQFFV